MPADLRSYAAGAEGLQLLLSYRALQSEIFEDVSCPSSCPQRASSLWM